MMKGINKGDIDDILFHGISGVCGGFLLGSLISPKSWIIISIGGLIGFLVTAYSGYRLIKRKNGV